MSPSRKSGVRSGREDKRCALVQAWRFVVRKRDCDSGSSPSPAQFWEIGQLHRASEVLDSAGR
jgi:hypothetical protein